MRWGETLWKARRKKWDGLIGMKRSKRQRNDRYKDTENCLFGGKKGQNKDWAAWLTSIRPWLLCATRTGGVWVCVQGRSPDVNLQWQGCCSINVAPPPMNQPTPNCLFPLCSSVHVCRGKKEKYSAVLWMTYNGKQIKLKLKSKAGHLMPFNNYENKKIGIIFYFFALSLHHLL